MNEQKARELFKISELIVKQKQGSLSSSEEDELNNWLAGSTGRRHLLTSLQDNNQQINELSKFANYDTESALRSTLHRTGSFTNRRFLFQQPVAIAAAIALIITFGFLIQHFWSTSSLTLEKEIAKNNIIPAVNKATLTFANGKKIMVNDLTDTIAGKHKLHIRKARDGAMIFETTFTGKEKEAADKEWNTLSTPAGGRYQVLLSDGTRVWLNAASYIRFPSEFAAGKREVETGGEVYFEVSKGKSPFMVRTASQMVEVLGTHFNINGYTDDPAVRTTLLEGKVRVNGTKQVVLLPGQQSINTGTNINVAQADAEAAIAWKNGLFHFEQESVQSIMRQVARWYNVEIEYDENVVTQKFSGSVSRFGSIAEVLKIMEETGAIRFKVKGRRIIVSR